VPPKSFRVLSRVSAALIAVASQSRDSKSPGRYDSERDTPQIEKAGPQSPDKAVAPRSMLPPWLLYFRQNGFLDLPNSALVALVEGPLLDSLGAG
jgi:hypothetical protein